MIDKNCQMCEMLKVEEIPSFTNHCVIVSMLPKAFDNNPKRRKGIKAKL